MIPDALPDGPEFALAMHILEAHAKLTFNEAQAYIWCEVLVRPWHAFGKSRQAMEALVQRAKKKISECEVPVLDMIKPYVEKIPFLIID